MREQLNNNPLLQLAVIGVLAIGAGFFLLSGSGGEEESEPTEATVTVAGSGSSGTASGATPGEAVEGAIDAATAEAGATTGPVTVPPLPPGAAGAAPPLPRAVTEAFEANRTVALLFVRKGGIDDRLVRGSVEHLRATLPRATVFVVPADRIARYAAITQGVAVERVPALVVVRPKRLSKGIPVASVSYGFQSPESVVQAVIDAGYKGPTLDYHP